MKVTVYYEGRVTYEIATQSPAIAQVEAERLWREDSNFGLVEKVSPRTTRCHVLPPETTSYVSTNFQP